MAKNAKKMIKKDDAKKTSSKTSAVKAKEAKKGK